MPKELCDYCGDKPGDRVTIVKHKGERVYLVRCEDCVGGRGRKKVKGEFGGFMYK